MISKDSFARKQLALAAGFGRYVFDHPEVDEMLPPKFFLYFEIAGDEEFNAYSRAAAARHKIEKGYRPVCVRVDGIAKSQNGGLLNPVIRVVKNPTRLKADSPRPAKKPIVETKRKSA